MKKVICFIYLLFFTVISFAQVTIVFPSTRAVFQRDKNNSANIYISGTFTKQTDRVEARLVPFASGQGSETTWQIIQQNPTGNSFFGKISGLGGWYRLEVRTIGNSGIIDIGGVDRIGIGEVFVIAGQSNAQGKYKNRGERGANDDRVNCVDSFNSNLSTDPLTKLNFSHVDQSVNIGPMGYGVWCWGELGDMLTARLNVPVMFFNAALENTSSLNWSLGAQGITTSNDIFTFPLGMPYSNLKNTLNFYTSILGIRAVLWHQGESDNFPLRTSANDYSSNLQVLINKSRADANKNLSWVISRASLTFPNTVYYPIIDGQNQVLSTANYNVFQGPITDHLQAPRPDGVHFLNTSDTPGLSILASAWNDYLGNIFFQYSTPYLGNPQVQVLASCNGNSTATLSLANSYASYRWTNGNTSNSISVNNTDNISYIATVRDNNNNEFITAPMAPSLVFPSVPIITPKSPTQFCADKSVELSVNPTFQNIVWNTGETSANITVRNTGIYSLKTTNILGCSSQSGNVSTTVFSLPATPNITIVNSPAVTCEGSIVVLISSIRSIPSLKSFWTLNNSSVDSLSEGSIALTNVGAYNYTLRAKDANGCLSAVSSPALVNIRANPAAPNITVTGSLSACDGDKVILTGLSNYKNFWTTGETGQSVSFTGVGDYYVGLRVQDDLGCSSVFSTKNFSIHPLPPKPSINVSGPLNSCEGSAVVGLSVSGNLKAFWDTPAKDSTQNISVSKSGYYSIAAKVRDDFNCYSPYSNAVKINIKPLPVAPSITQIGAYTMKATSTESLTNDAFEWRKDNIILANKSAIELKSSLQGNYSVFDLRTYALDNGVQLTCRSASSPLFSYISNPNASPLTVYPNPSTTGVFSLESRDDLNNVFVYVYTIKGQLVMTKSYSTLNERKAFDFSDLGGGEYLLKVKNSDFNTVKKIVIDK